ncbi:MAG: RHS repeat protein, partial [Chloroflexota bacterium]
MFAFILKRETLIRVILSAVILFSLASSTIQPVQAAEKTDAVAGFQFYGINWKPDFLRAAKNPDETTNLYERDTYETAQREQQLQIYTANGKEGLRLAQEYFGYGSLTMDWIVQKSASSSSDHETLTTFYSSSLPKGPGILRNFVGQFHYTVKPTEAGSDKWVSFQLAGIVTAAENFPADGWDRARFFVDITSPSGLPVTCSAATQGWGYIDAASFCIQDSSSHVHGMADGGWISNYASGSFNSGGSYARVAVTGLTAGQELIVTFYTPINDLNTNSSSSLDGCISSAPSANGFIAKPINTRTGNYEYFTEDISIPTLAGNLSFTRDYVSATISNTTSLSPGWTHNLDTRLIFPGQPESLADNVVFKAHTANRYLFKIDGVNNMYMAEPGLQATLVKNSGSPITFTLKCPGQITYTFNETGRLTTYANAQGHTWTYSYDADGKLDRVTAEGGKYLDLDYDGQGRIISVRDHTNRSVSYHYNANGDLDSFTDILGQTWTYEYNDLALNHYLTRVADPGNVTVEQQEYYPNGKAWKQYDGENNLVVELVYNADGTTTVKDALNNIETHVYNDRGVLIEKIDGAERNTRTQYDFNFRPTIITNNANQTLSMTWSADGANLLSKTDPAGKQTSYTYDSLNNLTSVTDPRGNTTTYTYNGKLLTSSTDALGGVTTYTYTPEGFLASVTDPAGRTTSYTYDSFGQRTSMTDPSGNTWTYTYDSLGRLIDTTDPRGRVTHNEYNAAGKLIRVTQNYDPSRPQNDQNLYNIVTEYTYDARGNQIAVTDTYGRTTQYVYDDADRLLQTIDPAGNVTTNTYDAAGRLISTTDPLGHTTAYEYDAAGRLIKTINALGFHSGTTTFNVSTNTSTVTDM